MLNRLRRPALLLTAAFATSVALTACGDSSSELFKGFDAVAITGSAGEAPTLDWKGRLEAGKPETKVIAKGDGPALAKGDHVLVNYLVANGWTHDIPINTFGDEAGGTMATVGTATEPEQLPDLVSKAVLDEIEPGMTVGTRLAVTANSLDLLGDYLGDGSVQGYYAGLDIGDDDGLVIVADLVAVPLDGPDGKTQKSPGWAPKVIEKDGEPTKLDFTGVPAPTKKLRVATLIEGQGAPVAEGQVAAVNYLGHIYDGKKPFDESYSGDEPFAAVLSTDFGTVVKGWSKGLVGVPVGSRVLLQIPPKQGYGDEAQGEDIPANSTLYFVVDVLAAA